jgi:hypothetical protein
MKGKNMWLTVAIITSLLLSIIALIRGVVIYEMVTNEMHKW